MTGQSTRKTRAMCLSSPGDDHATGGSCLQLSSLLQVGLDSSKYVSHVNSAPIQQFLGLLLSSLSPSSGMGPGIESY